MDLDDGDPFSRFLASAGGAGTVAGPASVAAAALPRSKGSSEAAARGGLPVTDADDGDDGDEDAPPMSQKAMNTSLLKRGDVEVQYAPVLPFLQVPDRKAALFRPFKLPGGAVKTADAAASAGPVKRLGARRKRRQPTPPTAFAKPKPLEDDGVLLAGGDEEEEGDAAAAEEEEAAAAAAPAVAEPVKFEPLVLWTPPEDGSAGPKAAPVSVDPLLCRFLREHQREGVQFVFDCIHGLKAFEGKGCILADDMGLGKTLQSITILYTALKQGIVGGAPTARRAIVVCPTSLVANWAKEIGKWVGEHRLRCIALAEASRDKAIMDINTFLSCREFPVLIISYETFRIHAARFHARPDACDLLICDEAHRLKNDATLTTQALAGLACRRRILLSGTPMQNDLDEFWAMVDFTNPGVLGDGPAFRKRYSGPILAAREPWASERQKAAGDEASRELSRTVNQFILRRTNALLSAHLPPKLLQVVCVGLSPLQRTLYNHFLSSKELHLIMSGKQGGVLASITALRKLVNHPKLIYDVLRARQNAGAGGRRDNEAAGFEDCEKYFPDNFHRERGACVEMSGKFELAARMLSKLRESTDDRIVIVSCYTQTLDLFQALCRENAWPFIRLDGSTGAGKRQKLVDQFNDPARDEFVFLLSSRAGGCGLNLIGGNRLILFDPDWNPATDLQAAARVWRDGQRKKVFVYRFLATGSLEEKVFQRQLSKKGLQTLVVEEGDESLSLSSDDLRNLFAISEGTPSDTHDMLRCGRCRREEVPEGGSDDELAREKAEDGERARNLASTAAAAAGAGGGGGCSSSASAPAGGAASSAGRASGEGAPDEDVTAAAGAAAVGAAAGDDPRALEDVIAIDDDEADAGVDGKGRAADGAEEAEAEVEEEEEDVVRPAGRRRPAYGKGAECEAAAEDPSAAGAGAGGRSRRSRLSVSAAGGGSRRKPHESAACDGMEEDEAVARALAAAEEEEEEAADVFSDADDEEEGGGSRRRRGGKGSKKASAARPRSRKGAAGAADASAAGGSVSGGKRGRAPSKAATKRAAKEEEAQRKAYEGALQAAIKTSLAAPLEPVEPGTVRRQLKWPAEDDIKAWSHHCGVDTVADTVLAGAGQGLVTFVFGLEVRGKDVSEFAPLPSARSGAGAGAGRKGGPLHSSSASSSSAGAAAASALAGSGLSSAGGGAGAGAGAGVRRSIGPVRHKPGAGASAAGSSLGGGFKRPGSGAAAAGAGEGAAAARPSLAGSLLKRPGGGIGARPGFKPPTAGGVAAGAGAAGGSAALAKASGLAGSALARGRASSAGARKGKGGGGRSAGGGGRSGGAAGAGKGKGKRKTDSEEDEDSFDGDSDEEEEEEPELSSEGEEDEVAGGAEGSSSESDAGLADAPEDEE